jgi:hypothetical protein
MIVIHEDCDAVEPAHEAAADTIERGLAARGITAIAATPAWEIEAWWLLWPEVVAGLVADWRTVSEAVGREVGLIESPKEFLRARLVNHLDARTRSRTRLYREADGPEIARRVREGGLVASPRGISRSWDAFRARVAETAA